MKIARGYALVLGAALAACAPEPGGEPAPEATAVAPAFHFQSGDLPLGEFDPHTIGDNLFDPCSEISDAEFAAAGFSKDPSGPIDQSAIGLKSCPIETDDPAELLGLIANAASADIIAAESPRISNVNSVLIPSAFAVAGTTGDASCFFVVETERGSLAGYAGSLFQDAPATDLCPRAKEILESFYSVGR